MTNPSLFIGVVSHEGSRFSASQGPDGLAAALMRQAQERGLSASIKVNTGDLHDSAQLPVDRALIQNSLSAQWHLEDAWRTYVRAGMRPAASDRVASLLRWGKRQWRRVRSPQPGSVTRLINIELSHMDLLRAGLASRARWILILEDDADSLDTTDCASGLFSLMSEIPAHVSYVNVSESFPLDELGVAHLLSPASVTWGGLVQRRVLTASRPVTNTVCAILYQSEFVAELLAEFDSAPMTPIVPIDFKLNAALMRMFADGRLGNGSCWLVSPAPIDQLSMRSGGTG